jgi:hypothetical protein
MNYENLDNLLNEWINGKFIFNFDHNDRSMTIADIPYSYRSSYDHDFKHVIDGKVKPFVIFHTTEKNWSDASKSNLDQWLVFVWDNDGNNPNIVRPSRIIPTSERRFGMYVEHIMNNKEPLEEQTEYIGDTVILKIHLPSGTAGISGKVDTGADISSLHAENIKMVGDQVRFVNTELSQNVITAPLKEKQAVKSADGGITNRPVIELDVEINGKPIRNALFNLNDRDHMEYQCLIGQNILEKTNFLIDPNKDGNGIKESLYQDINLLYDFICYEMQQQDLNDGDS